MAVPPEVAFHRFFQENCPFKPPVRPEDQDLRTYKGRDDLSGLSPSLREALLRIQEDFNKALQNEKRVSSGQRFHFDYVDSNIQNAIAFRFEDYSFVGITIPLINEMDATSRKLCGSVAVLNVLRPHCVPNQYDVKGLFATLFRIQLQIAISHEYAHHANGDSGAAFSNEILDTSGTGSLDQQASEIGADGLATYLVLSDLIDRASRPLVVGALKLNTEPARVQDEALFLCFVVAAGSFFFARELNLAKSFCELTHPPPSVRMMYLMQSAVGWCAQFRPGLQSIAEERFSALMDAVATATLGADDVNGWATQAALLSAGPGTAYLNKLRELCDHLNKGRASSS